jgi:hypothetical protein
MLMLGGLYKRHAVLGWVVKPLQWCNPCCGVSDQQETRKKFEKPWWARHGRGSLVDDKSDNTRG